MSKQSELVDLTQGAEGNVSAVNATLTGYLRGPATFTIDPAVHGNNTGLVVIAGNLQVDGTTTTINSTTMDVDDLNITVASGAANAAAANGAGLTVDGASATLLYASTGDKFAFNKALDVGGELASTGNLSVGVGNSKEAFIQATNSGRVASNPAYSFRSDPDTGMFNPNTDNTIAFATGGSERLRINSDGFMVYTGNMQLQSTAQTGYLTISGGNNSNNGANITMYGPSHASLANIIRFRDGATINMVIDADGKVGIGTTPSAWGTDYAVLDLNTGGSIYGTTSGVSTASNLYFTGSGWLAKNTGLGTLYAQHTGKHLWYSSASASAGSGASLSQKMELNASGILIVTGAVKSVGSVGVTQADGDYLAELYQTGADGYLQLRTGQATPLTKVHIASYGDSYFNAASGKLGVGTATPAAKLHVKTSGADGIVLDQDTGSANNSSRLFFNSTSGNWAVFNNSGLLNFQSGAAAGSTSGNYTDFQITTSAVICRRPFTVEANNLNISSGYGINFSANANAPGMSSEVLDDYEEGTWTPVITAIGTGGNAATATMSAPSYTKVGRVVNVQVYISGININAITGGTYITLQGFPFPCTNYADFTIAYKSGAWTSGNIIGGYMQSGTSYAYLMRADGVEAQQASTDVTMTKAMINITYQAA